MGLKNSVARQPVDFKLRRVATDEARELRDAVLRAGLAPGGSSYPGDDEPDTLHLGAVIDSVVIAVATICREAPPTTTAGEVTSAWRLRGMATLSRWRGCGIGERLAVECISHVRGRGATLVWCSARRGSVPFYERLGFEVRGEPYMLPMYMNSTSKCVWICDRTRSSAPRCAVGSMRR